MATVATKFKMQMLQVTEKVTKEQFQEICGVEVIYEEESDGGGVEIHIDIWSKILQKWNTTSLKYMILWKKSTSALWKSQGLLTSVLSYPLT